MTDEQKRCGRCGDTKAVSEFYWRKDTDNYGAECKQCRRLRSKAYFEANRERHHELVANRYRVHGRFARYGLSPLQYEKALEMQGHKCALCGASEPGGKGVWHIDHAHEEERRSTFKQSDFDAFRGVLCHLCNVSIGHYELLVRNVGLEAVRTYLSRPNPLAVFDWPSSEEMAVPHLKREKKAASPKPVGRPKSTTGCSVEGCNRLASSRGFCPMHYARHMRYGDAGEPDHRNNSGPRGTTNHNAKLNDEIVRAIRASSEPGLELARRYGITNSLVSKIRLRKTWRHVA